MGKTIIALLGAMLALAVAAPARAVEPHVPAIGAAPAVEQDAAVTDVRYYAPPPHHHYHHRRPRHRYYHHRYHASDEGRIPVRV